MQAVILAGGKGVRLRPITDYVPKPLVPIRNKPIIDWQINYLKKFNVSEIVICAGYKADMIQNYLDQKDFGIKVRFSVEQEPLGTGGAIKKASGLLSAESFFVINGDIITDIDLGRMTRPNCLAAVRLRTKFGIMHIKGDKITRFEEKKELQDVWMNAGIYHLGMDMAGDLPETGDIEKTAFVDYSNAGKLSTVMFPDALWHSIDSFKDIEDASLVVDRQA